LLEGVDLATLIRNTPALPLEAKLNIMAQVCDGLDYAHQRGIIHRDIKPANLHVSPAGLVKIVDFGIARMAATRMTQSGGIVGTPDYMSPEQVMAGEIDARSDLFAVGAVLYELLAGSRPFKADTITALLLKIVREPHVPLRERAPYLPAGAGQLVERLLAKDPKDRPASAREVQEALLAISTERPLFDASTIAVLASAVTQTGARTPVPQTPAPTPPPSSQKDNSSSKLASLALERGRALREAGDLAGAMKVFRSVLELAPGNAEALRELEEMEHAFERMTLSGQVAGRAPAAAQAAASGTAGGTGTAPTAPAPAAETPKTAPVASIGSVPRWAVGAGALAVVLLVAGSVLYLRDQPRQLESPAAVPEAPRAVPAEGAPPAQLPSTAIPSAPVTAPPPQPPPAPRAPEDGGRRSAARPAPKPDAKTSEPPRAEPASSGAAEPLPTPAPAAAPPPVVEAPRPAAPPVPAPVFVVRHFHSRSIKKVFTARGSCEGNLELIHEGFHFKTTKSSDGRNDDQKILFKDITDYEINDDRIRIESDNQNWEFGASNDVLRRILQHVKGSKRDEK